MGVIALILVACLPYSGDCKQVVQQPAPSSNEECTARAEALQQRLAGTMDDAGYRPVEITCIYGSAPQHGQ